MTTTERAVSALRAHAEQRSRHKRAAVVAALRQLADQDSEITIAAVARAAEVSREFIHTHPDLRQAVQTAAKKTRSAALDRTVAATDTRTAGLRAERSTLISQIERQRAVIAEQRDQLARLQQERQRWLGDQLVDLVVVDADTHAAVRMDNDRLVAENTELKQRLAAARRTLDTVEAELAASRQAHAEHVAELAADPRVTALSPRGDS